MRICWWIMTGLMLFPWMLALVPAGVAAYRRVSLKENRRRHLRWIGAVMLVTVLSTATMAFAGEPGARPAERLRGGVRDLTSGWTAFFPTLGAETADRGPAGVVVGGLEGTNQALQQSLRGAYETTTFFLPVPRPEPTASEPGTLLEVRF